MIGVPQELGVRCPACGQPVRVIATPRLLDGGEVAVHVDTRELRAHAATHDAELAGTVVLVDDVDGDPVATYVTDEALDRPAGDAP